MTALINPKFLKTKQANEKRLILLCNQSVFNDIFSSDEKYHQ